MSAAVADTGRYVVLDGGFGEALQGDLVAVSPAGQELYRRHYKANIFNIGISACGRYAAVQTASAPNSDGNRLEVLDIEQASKVFSVHPTSGWADRYSFDVAEDGQLQFLSVEHQTTGTFRYSSSGVFLDAQELQEANLSIADYGTKIYAARDLLKSQPTVDSARRALAAVDAALEEGAEDRPDWCAVAHRVRGESFELLGQRPEALKAFELALSLNPKIGVQRKASMLRKQLGAS